MIRRLAVLLLVIMIVFMMTACSQSGEKELMALSDQFLKQLLDEDYSSAYASFDAQMMEALPEAALQLTWELIVSQLGEYQGEISNTVESVDVYDRVIVKSDFSAGSIEMVIVFNKDKEISGLFFQ